MRTAYAKAGCVRGLLALGLAVALAVALTLALRTRPELEKEGSLEVNLTVWYRAPAPSSPPTAYITVDGADVEGHDLGYLKHHDTASLTATCNALPACLGFNSNGWLKAAAGPRRVSDATLYLKPATAVQPNAMQPRQLARNLQLGPLRLTSRTLLREQLEHMHRSLRIFVYPPSLGPLRSAPKDYKYGAEGLFPALLAASPFQVHDPSSATFFMIPVRCTADRYSAADRNEGQVAAELAMRAWVAAIQTAYPFWNRSAGADHFYVCAHDMGASVTRGLEPRDRRNLIGLVNTADRDDPDYQPLRDLALPPHVGDGCATCLQGGLAVDVSAERWQRQERNLLAFAAGHMQRGRVRPTLLKLFRGDPDVRVVDGVLSAQDYVAALYSAEFCLLARGHRGWSPRLMDAVWTGCIPVLLADGYDLPLQQWLDWPSFALLVPEAEVPRLKQRLQEALPDVPHLRRRLLEASAFLTWHRSWTPMDAFDMALLSLWQRRVGATDTM